MYKTMNDMKKEAKYAVGLDIGTTKIVAIVGKLNDYGKLEVIGLGKSESIGVKRGVVSNISQTISSIQKAVEDAEKVTGLKINEVVVGIAGQHIRSLQHHDYILRNNPDEVIEAGDVEKLCNQVNKLVIPTGEEIIHILPQEYKVDDQPEIREPVGMYGSRVEATFHVVLGQKSSIRNIGRCVSNAGLKLDGITLEPIASSDSVLTEEEKEAGVALIDIGGGTTDLAIFKDGIIRHTAVIPFGGKIITEDIKSGCSIIEKQAEQLKVGFGSAYPEKNEDNHFISIPGLKGRDAKEITKKNLSRIINARIVEIIQMVYAEIRNYGHDEDKKKLIAGIVLTGGGSEMKDIVQVVEYTTGMDTRIGYPNEHLAGDSLKEIKSPMYATSVGLLMNAIKRKSEEPEPIYEEPALQPDKTQDIKTKEKPTKSFIDKWSDKVKEFLDKAE